MLTIITASVTLFVVTISCAFDHLRLSLSKAVKQTRVFLSLMNAKTLLWVDICKYICYPVQSIEYERFCGHFDVIGARLLQIKK